MAGGEAGFHEGAEEAHTWRSGLNSGKLDRQVQPHQPSTQLPTCPECGSQRIWKDGVRCTNHGEVQRYICRACGYRFSETSWNVSGESEHVETVHTTSLYSDRALPYNRQVGVTEAEGTKNLAEVESRTEKRAAGATKPLPAEIKGKIIEYMYWLEKEGYKTTAYPNLIKQLAKCGVNLLDAEDVKKNIAKLPWKDSVKMLACYAYDIFVREILKTSWQMPKYTQEEALPFVADERELDQLIAACKSRRLAAFLQALKETYADPGEILKMEWKDISGNVISIRPVKGHNPGQIQVSDKLIAMLNALPKTSTKAFPCTYNSIRLCFHKLRKRVARNLQNPRFEEIAFRTFRHWGGTMIAHYTNGNILKVQKLLRHKRIQNTMKYIHMIKFEDNEFEVAAATTIEEEKELLKTGFNFIREKNNIALYRRPKRFSNI